MAFFLINNYIKDNKYKIYINKYKKFIIKKSLEEVKKL